MRLVIADDEPLVRSYLRSLVAEVLPSGAAVLEACDGKELAALVAEGRADAAFVDIRMPKMDGFAAMDAARESGRRIPWFVLSSHSDFAYARKALELGASGYALKPPSPEEIRNALSVLAEAVAEERRTRREKFDHDWTLFSLGSSSTPPDAGKNAYYSVSLVLTDGDIGQERVRRRGAAVATSLRERASRYADDSLSASAAVSGDDGSVAALAAVSAEPASAAALLRRFWNEVSLASESEVEFYGRARSLTLVAAAGDSASSAVRILGAMKDAAKRRALLPSGVLELGQAEAFLASAPPPDLRRADAADSLARCLKTGDSLGLAEAVRAFLSAEAGASAPGRFLERYFGSPLPDGAELLEAAERLLGASVSSSRDRDTVSAVEEYLRRNYAERIGVEGIAREFGLTPNYLSSLFHRRTGRTLVQSLTEIRLLRARDLLREGLNVKEAAWAVGYGSERHFTRLYRERFGYAPAVEKRNAQKS